jgi:anti-anti-sigma factor
MRGERAQVERSVTADGVAVVVVSGEIDFNASPALARVLASVPDGTPPRVVVDLERTGFMDSSGINVLLLANRRVREAGGWLRLSGIHEPVLSALRIVGVDEVIPVHPTVAAALIA